MSNNNFRGRTKYLFRIGNLEIWVFRNILDWNICLWRALEESRYYKWIFQFIFLDIRRKL